MPTIKRSGALRLFLSILAVFGLGVATPQLTIAHTSGPAASGSYQFSLEDGYTKYVEFDATTQADGSVTGSMTLTDEAEILEQDVDGTGDRDLNRSPSGLVIRVNFDGLAVNRNMAVMSGTVTDSNLHNYIGRRVLLVVEDNGEGTGEPDKLAWGIYDLQDRGWTPADAEVRDDQGWSLTWTATDAELRDDEGVRITRDVSIDCQSFPFESYSFFDPQHPAGDIQVRQ